MPPDPTPAPTPAGLFWTGWVVSALVILFLAVDGAMKLVQPAPVVEACEKLGIPLDTVAGIGLVLLACTATYAIPKTAVLGAVLLTGYLGGAVATHVRAGGGWFPVVFPVIIGVLAWAGLVLREPRLLWTLLLRH